MRALQLARLWIRWSWCQYNDICFAWKSVGPDIYFFGGGSSYMQASLISSKYNIHIYALWKGKWHDMARYAPISSDLSSVLG